MGYKFPHPWPTPFLIFLISTTTSTPPPSQPPPPQPPNATLKPSMTIIIGILTTIFSITFLLLLYTKHCRRSNNGYTTSSVPVLTGRYIDRENSGVDRTIIESLPVFRFGSLSGHKDGLECAVCLSKFNPSEVLRLLPKCKHAFHVECVDTWLDAHSTCPLCRYRVDPEDIFLLLNENDISRDIQVSSPEVKLEVSLHRVSGRHSSAGEKVTGVRIPAMGSRRSFDSSNHKKKVFKKMKKTDTVSAVKTGCLDRHRKDGLLLSADVDMSADVVEEERRRRRRSFEKRFEHRIVVGPSRWSDVQPSDLLYLRSEMILSRPSVLHGEKKNNDLCQNVINSRSVSEMTGLSRFGINDEAEAAAAGVLSRLLARLSEPKSGRNSSSSNV